MPFSLNKAELDIAKTLLTSVLVQTNKRHGSVVAASHKQNRITTGIKRVYKDYLGSMEGFLIMNKVEQMLSYLD